MEILIGRTPFEHVEDEQFSTKENLEKYWARIVGVTSPITLSEDSILLGPWQVGSYKMSRTVERIPKRTLKAAQKATHRV